VNLHFHNITYQNNLEVVQGPDGVTASPTLLGPVFVWIQQNYPTSLLMRYFESSYDCCPRARGKVGTKKCM